MNADEKRKVFEELLEEYQNFIESEHYKKAGAILRSMRKEER